MSFKSQDRSVVKTASADGKALAPWPCKRSSAWKGVGSFAVMCTLVKRWSLRSRRRIHLIESCLCYHSTGCWFHNSQKRSLNLYTCIIYIYTYIYMIIYVYTHWFQGSSPYWIATPDCTSLSFLWATETWCVLIVLNLTSGLHWRNSNT